jgi:hypothetical protein
MTKLIGGTISDTPIKNIGDGSAFSAGGGGADLVTIGSFGTDAVITGWHGTDGLHSLGGGPTPSMLSVFRFADNDYGAIWRSYSDNEVKYGHITFDGSGNPTFGTMQDLSGTFNASTDTPVMARGVSSTRCVVLNPVNTSARRFEICAMDQSSDTIVVHGSVQSYTLPTDSQIYCRRSIGLAVYDADTIVFSVDGIASGYLHIVPVKITNTKAIGTPVSMAVVAPEFPCKFYADPNYGSNPIYAMQNHLYELTVTPGATPSVALTTDHGADNLGICAVNGDTNPTQNVIQVPSADQNEYGEMFANNSGKLYYWSGETDDKNILVANFTDQHDASSSVPYLTRGASLRVVYIDKVGTVHRLIAVGNGDNGGIVVQPFNFDTSDYSTRIGVAVEDTQISPAGDDYMWDVIRPTSSSTRITIVTQDAATTVSYVYFDITV